MKKSISMTIISILMIAVFLTACSNNSNKTFSTLADFESTKIASITGSIFSDYIDTVVTNVKYSYYNSSSDEVAALKSNKVDAIALDKPVAELVVAEHTDLVIFSEMIADDKYGFAVTKGSDLAVNANAVLDKLRENGTLDAIASKWFSADETGKKLTAFEYDGSAGTIRYGCDSVSEPMSYIGIGGTPVGFDLDVVTHIAYELNMKVEFTPMNFDALLSSLASGKVDMVGGCMSITEERQKSVDFIGPYYVGGIALVVKKDRVE